MSNFTIEATKRYATTKEYMKQAKTSVLLIDDVRVKTLIIDMDITDYIKTDFKFKQYDYGTCFITAQLMDNNTPIDLTGNKIVGVFRGSDGNVVVDNNGGIISYQAKTVSVVDGVVKLEIPKDVIKKTRDIDCEIILFKDDKRITSPRFVFYIEESIFNHDTDLPDPPISNAPICGEVVCGEIVCGGVSGYISCENNIIAETSLSKSFLDRFGKGEVVCGEGVEND